MKESTKPNGQCFLKLEKYVDTPEATKVLGGQTLAAPGADPAAGNDNTPVANDLYFTEARITQARF